MTTNNVVGPIKAADWLTLIMLRGSIKFMKSRDVSKFGIAIRKEQEVYDVILKPYLTAANDNEPLTQAA